MPPPLDIALVRPATLDDVEALVAISSQVGIGHSKPDIVREDVAFSQSLIRGESAWNQGPLYLCSESYAADMTQRHGVVVATSMPMLAIMAITLMLMMLMTALMRTRLMMYEDCFYDSICFI